MDLNITSAKAALANGVRSTGDDALQLVDEDKQFSSQLPQALREWQLFDKGFSYDVVAVCTSYSSSTRLIAQLAPSRRARARC